MAKYNMDGGGGDGTATANPGTTTTAPEQPTGAATANPEKAPETPAKGDKEVFEEAKEKYRKDPKYILSPEEREAQKRIARNQARPGTPKAEATPAPVEQKAPEIPAPFKAAMERLKVDKPEDIASSVEKLQGELQRLNGERGNLGPLQERLTTSSRTIEHQHAIIRDLAAGKPEAMEWVKKNAQSLGFTLPDPKPANQPAESGDFNPDDALDVQTAKYVKGLESKLTAAMEKLEQLGQNTEKYGKFYETELEKQTRNSALQGAMSAIQNLLDTEGVSGLYDRRHGPIQQHMQEFFEKGTANERVQNVVEVLRIANEIKAENLQDAYFVWQGRNRGKLAVAAARSTQAPPAAPTVGLSDRQEGNGGRTPIGPTAEDVIAWVDGKKPIPREHIKNGRFDTKTIDKDVWAEVQRRRGRK